MGIRFNCPNGHKLNVKEFLAGKRGVCPQCGAKFTIPMSGEAPAAEAPLPVGIGQSQSVDIAVAPVPSRQAASAPASPSVIIPVTELELELAPPELELPLATREQPIPITDVLPTSIVAVQSPIIPEPIAVPPGAAIPSRRERSRRNQIVISLLLLALVVFLAGVLVWVLKREINRPPAEKTAAADLNKFNQACTLAGSSLLLSAHPRVGALKQ